MRQWLASHIGAVGGGGGLFALLALAFKDSMREAWQEWHLSRAAARARAAAGGTSDKLALALIDVFKTDLAEQRETSKAMRALLERLVTSQERSDAKNESRDRQLDQLHQHMIWVRGGVKDLLSDRGIPS